jgi:putative hydrolase of the HAD superfamily
VVFDYGQVICHEPFAEVNGELARLAGLPVETLDPLRWQYRGDFDRGSLSGKDYYRKITRLAGAVPADEVLEKMVEVDTAGWTRMDEGTIALMQDLTGARPGPVLKLGILSNMPGEFLRWAREALSVFKLIDVGIFSCELGIIKPEPGIYQALIAALDCEPGEIVFFDDVQANVDAAIALGIRAFLWKDPETARDQLREFGIL